MSSTDSISSLGGYILPGNSRSPQSAADQAAEAERLGLGTVWLGERFATKEAASVLGYLAGRTTRVRLATGTIMMQFRHPLALAGMCTTLQSLSSGRLDLGVSRSPGRPWSRLGLSPATTDYVEDYVAILKTLWSGEPVTYSGPVGHFSQMRLDFLPEVDRPRLLLAAVGPKALRLAGRCFDGVVLHGFLTPEAVARSRQIVRAAAVEAGRDPGTVRIYATVVVAPDKTEEEVDELVLMRAAQYLTNGPLSAALIAANGWDRDRLGAMYSSEPIAAARSGATDRWHITDADYRTAGRSIPWEWVTETSGIGSAEDCAKKLQQYFDVGGADEIVLHGTTAEQLGPLVASFTQAKGVGRDATG